MVYTDSETWAGDVHPVQALREYRQRIGIAARLVVVGMVSNGFTIADPADAGMLDVVGFDTATPAVIARLRGRRALTSRSALPAGDGGRPVPPHAGRGAHGPRAISTSLTSATVSSIMRLPMSTTTAAPSRHDGRPDRGRPRLQPLLHRPHRRAARRAPRDRPPAARGARPLRARPARGDRRRRPARAPSTSTPAT